MWRWSQLCAVLILLLTFVAANEVKIDQKETHRQQCSGMYSRKSWGGSVDPFILLKFQKPTNIPEGEDPMVSLVIFEWRDHDLIGKPVTEDGYERAYICDIPAADAGFCNITEEGQFILSDQSDSSRSQIITQAINLNNPPAVNYPVSRTGYYCVGTYGYTAQEYSGVIEFRNAYGELPAAQIAKLPFYGALTLVYALCTFGWAFLYFQNRHDILPVQNYITAILAFLVIEIFMTWLFYDFQNRHGLNGGAKALMIVVSVLSAGRNSFSFFLLLIVCMGYGVVKPSLGRTMIWVRALAATHFVFGVIYAVASLSVTPESAGPLVLLVVLPLAATLTAFYIWTLNSLNLTMKDLMERKQTIKAAMYRKLWWCLLSSIVIIFVFFFVNSWTFAGVSDDDFVPNHWSTRWFILDGWLNLVYFADVAFVSWLWRPTANNRRFAMSDEIAQDDEGFDLSSVRDSLDFDADELEGVGNPPAYDAPRFNKNSNNNESSSYGNRDTSPLPAPIPKKPSSLPRESLDGETIFAVGGEDENDKWSDESGDEEERRGLTGGKRD
ncbi:lung seven transmembrane receptor-domain-containing protein [Delphinella strobiligena]|nr:lung seven transmembrane receptor-domain-containing protein [Delphinella strobiligena]